MKKNDKLYEAVSNIDDGMIQTAYARQAEKKVRSGVVDAIAIAASIVLVALFGVFLSLYTKKDGNIAGSNATSAADSTYFHSSSEITDTESAPETVKVEYAELLPDDFGFSITWFDGMCSYDSRTGTLIKDKNASDVSRFTTTYKMESEMLFKIYEKLFDKIIISSYPDEYDPLDAASAEAIEASGVKLDTVVISVTADGEEKTVTCKNIQFGGEGGYDERASEFIEAEYMIIEYIEISSEWKALPEFESL